MGEGARWKTLVPGEPYLEAVVVEAPWVLEVEVAWLEVEREGD